jgi:hypothetical protein
MGWGKGIVDIEMEAWCEGWVEGVALIVGEIVVEKKICLGAVVVRVGVTVATVEAAFPGVENVMVGFGVVRIGVDGPEVALAVVEDVIV